MALANSAWGQDANVTTGANSAKLGGEFRAEYMYTNNGLDKVEGYTPPAESWFQVQTVNVTLKGKVNAKTDYAFRFNLLRPNATSGAVDYAYGSHWFSDSVGFSMGQMKTLIGGWDLYGFDYRTHAIGLYHANLPVSLYQPVLAFHLKAAGQITLQLFNDVADASGARWNKNSHPTYALGWMGKFGPIEPLVNIGTYDNQKSRWIDVGIKTNMSGLVATLDFNQNSYSNKVPDGSSNKSEEDVATNISLRAGYEMKGAATPWLYFSTYDNKQHGTDSKVNSPTAAGETGHHFDDNGQVFGLGADLNMFGDNWNPYVALVSTSGKWMEGADEKSKSDMQIKLGVLGSI
jgi:hypothetical protein